MSNAKLSTSEIVDTQSLVLIVNSTGTGEDAVANNPYRMNTPNCVVGSGPKANWMVSNANLQPEHAEFVRLSCGAYVRGLDTPNDKLLVNGQPVSESWIHSGDRLTMGNLELLVEGIGNVEFGSCEQLASLIYQTSDSFGEAVSPQPVADGVRCLNYKPVAAAETAELVVDVADEESEPTDCPSTAESESDRWFLVDSLVEDNEKYECETESDDSRMNDDSDSPVSVKSADWCESNSENDLPAPLVHSSISELEADTQANTPPIEQEVSAAFVGNGNVESEESGFHDIELDEILDNMSDPCFEMSVESEATEAGEQEEIDKETVFNIPRIETETTDEIENTKFDKETVASPVRSNNDQQATDSGLSNGTDPVAETPGQLPEDSGEVKSLFESGMPESEFLADSPEPVMARQTDYSNEQAGWLNELYDSIIPDEQDNAGTPIAGNNDDSNDETNGPESQSEHSSWLSNRPFDVSGLMKPGGDPESVSSLPDTNHKHAAELFSKFDSINDDSHIDHKDKLEPESMVHRSMEPESIEVDSTEAESMAFDSMDAELPEAETKPDDESLESNMDHAKIDESSEPESAAAVEPPAPAPSVAEVLEQMRQSGEVSLDFDNDPQPPATALNQVTVSPSTNVPENEPKDDFNDYMSQLLNRLSGGAPVPTMPAEKGKTAQSLAQSPKPTSKKDIDDLVPANPLKADEYVSKSTLPEKPGSLMALRQIANQSVQTAIHCSLQNKNQNSSTMYLAGSGFAFFLSVVLFIMSSGWFDLAFIAACISSVVCALSGYMFISVNNGLEKLLEYRKQKQDDKQDSPQEDNPESIVPDQPTN